MANQIKLPHTLEEALALIPEHLTLIPKLHTWQTEDEYLPTWNFNYQWSRIDDVCDRKCCGGKKVGKLIEFNPQKMRAARRRVPDYIRKSEAWWLLHDTLATVNAVASPYIFSLMVRGNKRSIVVEFVIEGYGVRGFHSPDAAKEALATLGGEEVTADHLWEGRGLLNRWLAGSLQ